MYVMKKIRDHSKSVQQEHTNQPEPKHCVIWGFICMEATIM